MSEQLKELEQELITAIENLSDHFDEYDFKTKKGYSSSDIDGIEGFTKLAVEDDEVVSFPQFKKLIRFEMFCTEEEGDLSDFDWDQLESLFDEVTFKFDEYKSFKEQIEDNLTGDQTVETAKVRSGDAMKQELIDYMVENNLLYELVMPDGEIVYMPSAELEAKLLS